MLQIAAEFIPIPFIQAVIGLALKVLQACEVRQFSFYFHSCLSTDRIPQGSLKPQLSNDLRVCEVLQDVRFRLKKIQNGIEGLHTKFDQILFDLYNAKRHNVSNRHATYARKACVFHGRDQLVQELAHLLSEETTSRVCILVPAEWVKLLLFIHTYNNILEKIFFLPP